MDSREQGLKVASNEQPECRLLLYERVFILKSEREELLISAGQFVGLKRDTAARKVRNDQMMRVWPRHCSPSNYRRENLSLFLLGELIETQ